MELFHGDTAKIDEMNRMIAADFGFDRLYDVCGQTYPRKLDSRILNVLSSIAQQERETIHQRQAEGIATAKEKGKHLGRPSTQIPSNWDTVITRWRNGEITAVEAMRQTGVKRSTFYKLNG